MTRGAAAALVLVFLLAACGKPSPPRPSPNPSPEPSPTQSTTPPAPSPTVTPARGCRGVTFDQVRGPRPSYGPQKLRRYRAERTVCGAYWLRQSAQNFVPQSLAVTGNLAYVGGYRWAPTYAKRPCQIAVVDLRTGQEVAFQAKFQASVYRPAPTYCRHGGGMDLAPQGLWVQETERLWLLDPAKVGHGDPVKRVWRMQKGTLRGSTMLVRGGMLGVASFRPRGLGRIVWFRISDLLRPGVDDLVVSGGDRTDARPVSSGRVPALLQGITHREGRLWYATSTAGCGSLVRPDGTRLSFVPGAEDLQFVGRSLYVVSETGARPYVKRVKSTMPVLLRLDTAKVGRLVGDCRR